MFDTKRELGCWLAALLDGEGCLFAGITTTHNNGPSLRLDIRIYNNSISLLECIQTNFSGGHIYTRKVVRNGKELDPNGTWNITTKDDILTFVSLVKPFIVIKKKKVALIEALANTLTTPGKKPDNHTLVLRDKLLELWNDRSRSKQITAGAVGNA